MSGLSLLDTADSAIRRWFVVYHDRNYRCLRWLKPGFRHVELVRPVYYGPALSDVMWVGVFPRLETLDADVTFDSTPPWVRCPESAIQHVRVSRPLERPRERFHVGPITCVEIAKYVLGISSFWVRTPWQLHQFIQRRGGVITG